MSLPGPCFQPGAEGSAAGSNQFAEGLRPHTSASPIIAMDAKVCYIKIILTFFAFQFYEYFFNEGRNIFSL